MQLSPAPATTVAWLLPDPSSWLPAPIGFSIAERREPMPPTPVPHHGDAPAPHAAAASLSSRISTVLVTNSTVRETHPAVCDAIPAESPVNSILPASNSPESQVTSLQSSSTTSTESVSNSIELATNPASFQMIHSRPLQGLSNSISWPGCRKQSTEAQPQGEGVG
jgi:hypothetical protein